MRARMESISLSRASISPIAVGFVGGWDCWEGFGVDDVCLCLGSSILEEEWANRACTCGGLGTTSNVNTPTGSR